MKKRKKLTEIKAEIARIDSRIAEINRTIAEHLDNGQSILPLVKEELELKRLHWKLTAKSESLESKLGGMGSKSCLAIRILRKITNQYAK